MSRPQRLHANRRARSPGRQPAPRAERRDWPPSEDELHRQLDERDAAIVAADPWLRPALDWQRIEALGDAFRRPYHALDDDFWPADDREEEKLSVTVQHAAACSSLGAALDIEFRDRDDVLVVSDVALFYDAADAPKAGRASPDLMVVFNAPKHRRRSYQLWRERKPPAFALEVASRATWRRDVGAKRDIYANLSVADYFVLDPQGYTKTCLRGFAWRNGGYRELALETMPDGMQGVYSQALGLYLCRDEPWPAEGWDESDEMGRLRWYNPKRGEYLDTPAEAARRADAEAERAAAAESAREAAQARNAALEARIRELESRR